MVLRYMLSDMDLAESKVAQPRAEVVQDDREIEASSEVTTGRRIRGPFRVLIVIGVIVLATGLLYWNRDKTIRIWQSPLTSKGMVTGIMYNPESPRAVVHGQVVREQDVIDGLKVIKIYRDKVVLKKGGKTVIARVSE